MNESILNKDNWFDKSISYSITDIFEYDMRRAGLSIITEDQLLSPTEIASLKVMPKREADKQIGKMQIKNKVLKEGLMNGFRKYRLLFGELNALENTDIISVKKDAIFTSKYCENTALTTNIEFVEKNHYESRLYLESCRCEFYWSQKGIDVKGISDDNVAYHRDYILDIIWHVMRYMNQYDNQNGIKYLVKFMNKYKKKQLPIEFYREFNQSSMYSYVLHDDLQTSIELDEVYKPAVLGQYNYISILVPLLNLLMD